MQKILAALTGLLLAVVSVCADSREADDAFLRASDLALLLDFASAQKMLDESLAKNPNSAELIFLQAFVSLKTGESESSKKEIEKLSTLSAGDISALCYQASYYAYAKQQDRAAPLWEKIIKIEPKTSKDYVAHMYASIGLGDADAFKAAYAKAVELDPESEFPYFSFLMCRNMAHAYTMKKDYAGILKASANILKINPKSATALLEAAAAEAAMGGYAKAADYCNAAYKYYPQAVHIKNMSDAFAELSK